VIPAGVVELTRGEHACARAEDDPSYELEDHAFAGRRINAELVGMRRGSRGEIGGADEVARVGEGLARESVAERAGRVDVADDPERRTRVVVEGDLFPCDVERPWMTKPGQVRNFAIVRLTRRPNDAPEPAA
jgi:hypothetical protein